MPIVVLVALIIELTLAMFLFLRPLKVLAKKEFLISHGFIIAGLFVILGWLWLNLPEYEATMIMGGIWTLFGGLCFVSVYISRKFRGK
jgi:hypothetical protein